MEQNNTVNHPHDDGQSYSYIDELLRRLALPAIIAGALVIILFGLIIHFQTAPALSEALVTPSPEPVATAEPTSTPEPTETPFTIIVDAGHGGTDPGAPGYSAINEKSGIYEDQICLAISLKLEEVLKENGFAVLMTRPDENDLGDPSLPLQSKERKQSDLDNRVKFITESGADMLISIHQNTFSDPSVHGPEVWYDDSAPAEGVALARCIQDALVAELNIEKPRDIRPDGLAVVDPIPCSVLVECGFITNKEEEQNLLDPAYQERIAKAILKGVEDYLASHPA